MYRAKKSSLASGNRPGEKIFITHPPAQLNVYQNIYLQFQKTNRKKKKNKNTEKAQETKEEKKISPEN